MNTWYYHFFDINRVQNNYTPMQSECCESSDRDEFVSLSLFSWLELNQVDWRCKLQWDWVFIFELEDKIDKAQVLAKYLNTRTK